MRCLSLLLMTLSTTSLIACGESPPPDVKLGAPVDEDGDGYPDEHDCDDGDAAINPSADERCDGIDNDCDGEIDEHAVDRETFWADRDGDGFGDAARATEACSAPGGFVENADDCDDTDPSVSPDGAEVCNDVDDDCDGLVDADDDSIDPSGLYTVWPDLDGDHKGDRTAAAFQSCRDRGGVSLVGDDCDDSDPWTYPGAAPLESASACMQDLDHDSWGAASPTSAAATPGTDCDDSDPLVSPDRDEVCGNGIDDNCDGDIDEGCG
jgi:hypothetical protein